MHCISGLAPAGAETALQRLVCSMTSVDSHVVSINGDGPAGDLIRGAGVPLTTLDKTPGRPDPRAAWKLSRVIRQERPDVVHAWMYEANLYALAATRLAGAGPLVWGIRCADLNWAHYRKLTALAFRLNNRLGWQPDMVVANSRAGLDYHLAQGMRPRRACVIPNGFDLATLRPDATLRRRFRGEVSADDDTIVVGLVARRDPVKDIDTFVRACARLHRDSQRYRFVLAGRGFGSDADDVWESIRGRGGESFARQWRLLGHRTDIGAVMNGLDVLALTSTSEGFPNVIGEAMACGTPCVSTRVGDAGAIIGDDKHLAAVGDADGIAAAVRRLANLGAQARESIGLRARRRIGDQFGIDTMVARHAALYDDLCRQREAKPCAA